MVVGVAVAVHTVVEVVQVDGVEGVDMGREGEFAVGGEVLQVGHYFTVEGRDRDVFEAVGHFEGVGGFRDLATGLGDAYGHVVGAGARGSPSGVIIAVVGVVRIVGLQGQRLSVNGGFHFFELQDVAMVDIGAYHDHHGILEVGHIHLGALVGTADGDLRSVVVGVHHIERAGDRRGTGSPEVEVASREMGSLYTSWSGMLAKLMNCAASPPGI